MNPDLLISLWPSIKTWLSGLPDPCSGPNNTGLCK